jgi:hypothetical protein
METLVGPTHRFLLIALALLCAPISAEAQWRPPYPGYYPYRYSADSDLRFSVKPKEASVYVDGYFAGHVDDFDGAFQRLHVAPGEHEIVVFLDGYRSLRQRLYLSPNKTRKIEGTLERLAADDPPEEPPVPTDRPDHRSDNDRMPAPRPLPGDARGRVPDNRQPAREPPAPPASTTMGSISLRVQPSGTTVLIDSERWEGPADAERLIVQVPEGRHTIVVERDGFNRVVTDVDVRRGQTVPVNISLTRAP